MLCGIHELKEYIELEGDLDPPSVTVTRCARSPFLTQVRDSDSRDEKVTIRDKHCHTSSYTKGGVGISFVRFTTQRRTVTSILGHIIGTSNDNVHQTARTHQYRHPCSSRYHRATCPCNHCSGQNISTESDGCQCLTTDFRSHNPCLYSVSHP